jgi:hypothetical protein
MPESVVARTKRDLVTTWSDAGAVHTYTPYLPVGDFGYEAPLYGTTRIRDRGNLVGIRKGDEEPVTCSMTVTLTDVGSSSYATLPDLCEERGYVAATWVSTTDGLSDVPTFDITNTIDGASFGEADKSMVFPDMVTRQAGASFGDPAQYPVQAESATATKPTVS